MTRRLAVVSLVSVLLLAACGGSTGSPPADALPSGQGVVVQTVPSDVDLEPGQTVNLSARVTGAADGSVTWTVVEPAGGTVDSTGAYTAPATEGTYHVVASSAAALKSSGTTVVKVKKGGQRAIAVAISPPSTQLPTGGTATFTATVTGTTTGTVTWSVAEGATCGSVTPAGLYVAPSVASTCHVVATSTADATRTAIATVAVSDPQATPPVTVAVNPPTATLDACRALVLTATVGNAKDGSVTWSVLEGSAGGTVAGNGIYTAPRTAGTYHVVATSVADPARTAQATLTVGAEKVVSVALTPSTVTVAAGGSQAFAASVTTTCGIFAAR
jgi:hypothetical protein